MNYLNYLIPGIVFATATAAFHFIGREGKRASTAGGLILAIVTSLVTLTFTETWPFNRPKTDSRGDDSHSEKRPADQKPKPIPTVAEFFRDNPGPATTDPKKAIVTAAQDQTSAGTAISILKQYPEIAKDESLMKEVFEYALAAGRCEAIEYAIELNKNLARVDLEGGDEDQGPLLRVAIMKKNKRLVSFLLDRFPGLDKEVSAAGETLLMGAINSHDVDIVNLVINKCPGIEKMKAMNGDTPLHFTLKNFALLQNKSMPLIVNALLDADPGLATEITRDNRTPEDILRSNERYVRNADTFQQVLESLKAAGQRTNKSARHDKRDETSFSLNVPVEAIGIDRQRLGQMEWADCAFMAGDALPVSYQATLPAALTRGRSRKA